MQFQTMQEFLVLADTLNFLNAAEQLYMSQSTLSKHIRDMEKELGAPLFKRSTRSVELTELGMCLIPYAQRAVELQNEYLKEVEDYKERQNNQLIIGCISHWNEMDLGMMTLDFQKKYPNITISITTTDHSKEYIPMVEDGTCHFAIVKEENNVPEDGLNRILLCEDPLYVFLPKTHPLAANPSVSLQELIHDPFLLGPDGSLSNKLAVTACQEASLHPRIIYRGDRPQALNYLSHGLGIALMFGNLSGRSPVERNIVRVPLSPGVYANINLLYKESKLSEAGRLFLDFVKKQKFRSD